MELLLDSSVIDLSRSAEVARRDACMTAQLLLLANHNREANDRFYRIEDCLVQVGASTVRRLVRTMPRLLVSDARCYSLLEHSRLTALAAEAIAPQASGLDPEKAYLAGLLHLFPELISPEGCSQDSFLGDSSAWPLPLFVWRVIRGFEHPHTVSGDERLLCEVVHAACEWASRAERR